MLAGRADAARRVVTRLLRRNSSTAQLVQHVGVDPLGDGAFLGQSLDLGWGRIYGGQTMAQAVAACQEVAGPGRSLHQFSCHFLRGGDTSLGVHIDATELSSGRSFSCVHARAMQAGRPILAMTANLQTPEAGFVHQPATGLRPEWLTPHDLRTLNEHMRPYLSHLPNERLRQLYSDPQSPVDIRPVEFVSPWDTSQRPAERAIWMRVRGPLPDDRALHERLLTYLSDWSLLETALFPHGASLWSKDVTAASLTHSMHFHAPVRADEWLCHAMRSPAASGARGFCLGEIWSESGVLVASSSQEGLIRSAAIAAADAEAAPSDGRHWLWKEGASREP